VSGGTRRFGGIQRRGGRDARQRALVNCSSVPRTATG
jgi:hypothetical protein